MRHDDDDAPSDEIPRKPPRRGTWIPFVTVMLVISGMAATQMLNRRSRQEARRYPPPSIPATDPAASPSPPRAPLHDLGAALGDLEVVEPTTDPCPVSLSAPTASLVAAQGVRDMTREDLESLRYPNGEPFGVVRVEPGAPITRTAESHDRYQALYLMESFEAASIDMRTRTYSPSRSRGRAYVIDTESDRVICAADVDVESIPEIRAEQRAEAEMWLTMQIQHSERRAIATGMHAVARRE